MGEEGGFLKRQSMLHKNLETMRDLYLTWLRTLTDQHHVIATLLSRSLNLRSFLPTSVLLFLLFTFISPRNPLFSSTQINKSSNPGEVPDLSREFQLSPTKVKGQLRTKVSFDSCIRSLTCLLFLPSLFISPHKPAFQICNLFSSISI